MGARYTGKVCFWDPAGDFGEIQPGEPTMGRVVVAGADLRRCGAAEIGAPVTFENGVMTNGVSGAVNIERQPG